MTKTKPDYSAWYTKQEASSAIGVSTKTIEQYAKDGTIAQGMYKRPTGGPLLAVFSREDVDRIAAERKQPLVTALRPFVMPPAGENGHALAGPVDGAAILQAMLAVQKASQTSEKLFLTIPEAAEFSGLSEAYIRRGCREQTIAAIRDGGWKIKRAALLAL